MQTYRYYMSSVMQYRWCDGNGIRKQWIYNYFIQLHMKAHFRSTMFLLWWPTFPWWSKPWIHCFINYKSFWALRVPQWWILCTSWLRHSWGIGVWFQYSMCVWGDPHAWRCLRRYYGEKHVIVIKPWIQHKGKTVELWALANWDGLRGQLPDLDAQCTFDITSLHGDDILFDIERSQFIRELVVSLLKNFEHHLMLSSVIPEIPSTEDSIMHRCWAILHIIKVGVKLGNESTIEVHHLADLWICKLLESCILWEPLFDAKWVEACQIVICPLCPRSFVLHTDVE